jgi:hypothetical protein
MIMTLNATRNQCYVRLVVCEGRSAFSLTELLVASGIGLVLMGAVAALFSTFTRALSQGQTTVEMGGKMRTVAWRLRKDLAGITVPMQPPARPEAGAGYFELIEGSRRDADASADDASAETVLSADTDDILCFTTTSAGGLFIGKYGPNDTAESGTAEVAWFCRPANPETIPAELPPGTQLCNLYRRQFLVLGYVGKEPFFSGGNRGAFAPSTLIDFDISLRTEISGGTILYVPNTLADLTDRRNRFGHNPGNAATFPFRLVLAEDGRVPPNLTFDETLRAWEDVALTNVLAFDVRVFDPRATSQPTSGISLFPGDPGYSPGTGAYGAYIDLGSGQGSGILSGAMDQKARLLPGPSTYCTWSTAYERNGMDDDGHGIIDQGTNGVDDNGNGLVDEPSESETAPPYSVPLRGIEVRIRCYDPVSKQVRQITIRQAFN